MRHSVTVVGVQISSAHSPGTGHSGLGGMIVFFAAVTMICYGMIPTYKARRWRHEAYSAIGVVADNLPRPTWRRSTLWSPLVEFSVDGSTVKIAAPPRREACAWELGRRVTVFYSPSNPASAAVDGVGGRFSLWLIGGGILLALFILAISS